MAIPAALWCAASFRVGALLPLVAVLVAPAQGRTVFVVMTAIVALGALGSAGGAAGGAPITWAAFRVGIGGASDGDNRRCGAVGGRGGDLTQTPNDLGSVARPATVALTDAFDRTGWANSSAGSDAKHGCARHPPHLACPLDRLHGRRNVVAGGRRVEPTATSASAVAGAVCPGDARRRG